MQKPLNQNVLKILKTINLGSGHANWPNGSLKMHMRFELICKCCFYIRGLILMNARCRI